MTSVKDILKNIPEGGDAPSNEDVMLNPDYLRHSSSIISEALQKGFDVLQLDNGDIVTTGTKIVVTQYHWDEEKQSMTKLSAKDRKKLEQDDKSKDSDE